MEHYQYLHQEYYGFQDSDDYSLPDRIEKQITAIKNNKSLASTCLCNRYNGSTCIASTIFKNDVFDKLGYFENNRFGSDTEYLNRFFIHYEKKSGIDKLIYDKNSKSVLHETGKYYIPVLEKLYFVNESNLSLTKIYPLKERNNYFKYLRKKEKKIKNNKIDLFTNFECIVQIKNKSSDQPEFI